MNQAVPSELRLEPLKKKAAVSRTVTKYDDCLPVAQQQKVYDFLMQSGWKFGWKSDPRADRYAFWHQHFAGSVDPEVNGSQPDYECAGELSASAPILHRFWIAMSASVLKGHKLVRCYANGHVFGGEGTLHVDAIADTGYTAIYFAHPVWSPNWGGETVFFNDERDDILVSVYPRPNRLIVFRGNIPHVARGLTRTCPVLRATLMFKTEDVHG